MSNSKSILTAFSVLGVGMVLSITIFLVNQPQDLRPQASTIKLPTPTIDVPGCPAKTPDGKTTICRTDTSCQLGEVEKTNGDTECTQRMGKSALCCLAI